MDALGAPPNLIFVGDTDFVFGTTNFTDFKALFPTFPGKAFSRFGPEYHRGTLWPRDNPTKTVLIICYCSWKRTQHLGSTNQEFLLLDPGDYLHCWRDEILKEKLNFPTIVACLHTTDRNKDVVSTEEGGFELASQFSAYCYLKETNQKTLIKAVEFHIKEILEKPEISAQNEPAPEQPIPIKPPTKSIPHSPSSRGLTALNTKEMLGLSLEELFKPIQQGNWIDILASLEDLGFVHFHFADKESSLLWALLPYKPSEKQEFIYTFFEGIKKKEADIDEWKKEFPSVVPEEVAKTFAKKYSVPIEIWELDLDAKPGEDRIVSTNTYRAKGKHPIELLLVDGIYYSFAPTMHKYSKPSSYARYLGARLQCEEPMRSYCDKIIGEKFNEDPEKIGEFTSEKMDMLKSAAASVLQSVFHDPHYLLVHQWAWNQKYLPAHLFVDLGNAVNFNATRHLKIASIQLINKSWRGPTTSSELTEDLAKQVPEEISSSLKAAAPDLGDIQLCYNKPESGFSHEEVVILLRKKFSTQEAFLNLQASWEEFFDNRFKLRYSQPEKGVYCVFCQGPIYLDCILPLITSEFKELIIKTDETVYLNGDIKLPGTNLVILARDVVALKDLTIDLSGEDAEPLDPVEDKAKSGEEIRREKNKGSTENECKGTSGEDGKSGNAGGSSGILSISVDTKFDGSEKVTVKLKGGNGGNGLDGGDAEPGSEGKNGVDQKKDLTPSSSWDWPGRNAVVLSDQGKLGTAGGNGGNGGLGGLGGQGGFGGEVHCHPHEFKFKCEVVKADGKAGNPGEPGKGGEGGKGGSHGLDFGVQWVNYGVLSKVEEPPTGPGEFDVETETWWIFSEKHLKKKDTENTRGLPNGVSGSSSRQIKQQFVPSNARAQRPELLSQLSGALKAKALTAHLEQLFSEVEKFRHETMKKKKFDVSRLKEADDPVQMLEELVQEKMREREASKPPESLFPVLDDLMVAHQAKTFAPMVDNFLVAAHETFVQEGNSAGWESIKPVLKLVIGSGHPDLAAAQLLDDWKFSQAVLKDSHRDNLMEMFQTLFPRPNKFDLFSAVSGFKWDFDDHLWDRVGSVMARIQSLNKTVLQDLFLNLISRKLALRTTKLKADKWFSSGDKNFDPRKYYMTLFHAFEPLRLLRVPHRIFEALKEFPELPDEVCDVKVAKPHVLAACAPLCSISCSSETAFENWLIQTRTELGAYFTIKSDEVSLNSKDTHPPCLDFFLALVVPNINLTEFWREISDIYRLVSKLTLAIPLSQKEFPMESFKVLEDIREKLDEVADKTFSPRVKNIQELVKTKLLPYNYTSCRDQVSRLLTFWGSVRPFVPWEKIDTAYRDIVTSLTRFQLVKDLETDFDAKIERALGFLFERPKPEPGKIDLILYQYSNYEKDLLSFRLKNNLKDLVELRCRLLSSMFHSEENHVHFSPYPLQRFNTQLLAVQECIIRHPKLPVELVKTEDAFEKKLSTFWNHFQDTRNANFLALELSTTELSSKQVNSSIQFILKQEKMSPLLEPLLLKLLPLSLLTPDSGGPERSQTLDYLIQIGKIRHPDEHPLEYWKGVYRWTTDLADPAKALSDALEAAGCKEWKNLCDDILVRSDVNACYLLAKRLLCRIQLELMTNKDPAIFTQLEALLQKCFSWTPTLPGSIEFKSELILTIKEVIASNFSHSDFKERLVHAQFDLPELTFSQLLEGPVRVERISGSWFHGGYFKLNVLNEIVSVPAVEFLGPEDYTSLQVLQRLTNLGLYEGQTLQNLIHELFRPESTLDQDLGDLVYDLLFNEILRLVDLTPTMLRKELPDTNPKLKSELLFHCANLVHSDKQANVTPLTTCLAELEGLTGLKPEIQNKIVDLFHFANTLVPSILNAAEGLLILEEVIRQNALKPISFSYLIEIFQLIKETQSITLFLSLMKEHRPQKWLHALVWKLIENAAIAFSGSEHNRILEPIKKELQTEQPDFKLLKFIITAVRKENQFISSDVKVSVDYLVDVIPLLFESRSVVGISNLALQPLPEWKPWLRKYQLKSTALFKKNQWMDGIFDSLVQHSNFDDVHSFFIMTDRKYIDPPSLNWKEVMDSVVSSRITINAELTAELKQYEPQAWQEVIRGKQKQSNNLKAYLDDLRLELQKTNAPPGTQIITSLKKQIEYINNLFDHGTAIWIGSRPLIRKLNEAQIKSFLDFLRDSRAYNIAQSRPEWVDENFALIMALIMRAYQIIPDQDGKVRPTFRIKKTQLLAICLLVDGKRARQGRLGQVATGEGKTLITAVFALLCALTTSCVNIITSSSVLAVRDAQKNTALFTLFGISVSNNCDSKALEDLKEREQRYHSPVVYGDIGSFQRDYLLSKMLGYDIIGNRAEDVVLVDEVDSLLLDKSDNTLYLSHAIPDLRHFMLHYIEIWALIHSPELKECTDQTIDRVAVIIREKVKSGTLPLIEGLQDFFESRLITWIETAYQAAAMELDDEFTVFEGDNKNNDVIVIDKLTGVEQVDMKWNNGLHQFLQLKNARKITSETLKAIYMSNISYFRLFEQRLDKQSQQHRNSKVFGLTGTLGNDTDKKLLTSMYNVDFFKLPRAETYRFEEQKAVVCEKPEDWEAAIAKDVQTKINAGRSILVVCESPKSAKEISKLLEYRVKGYAPDGLIKYFYGHQTEDLKLEALALPPRHIIVSTTLASRGTDITIQQDVSEAGGLHVVLTYLPPTIRSVEQVYGRAARNGSKGSARPILWDDRGRDYKQLNSERDEQSRQRAERFRVGALQGVVMEQLLFDEFKKTFEIISALLKEKQYNKYGDDYAQIQLDSLKSLWAFWLDKMQPEIKAGPVHKDEILDAFAKLSLQMVMLIQSEGPLKLCKLPHDITRLATFFLREKLVSEGNLAVETIINSFPKHAELAYMLKVEFLALNDDKDTPINRRMMKRAAKHAHDLMAVRSLEWLSIHEILKRLRLMDQKAGRGLSADIFTDQVKNYFVGYRAHQNALSIIIGSSFTNETLIRIIDNEEGQKSCEKLWEEISNDKDILIPPHLRKRIKFKEGTVSVDGELVSLPLSQSYKKSEIIKILQDIHKDRPNKEISLKDFENCVIGLHELKLSLFNTGILIHQEEAGKFILKLDFNFRAMQPVLHDVARPYKELLVSLFSAQIEEGKQNGNAAVYTLTSKEMKDSDFGQVPENNTEACKLLWNCLVDKRVIKESRLNVNFGDDAVSKATEIVSKIEALATKINSNAILDKGKYSDHKAARFLTEGPTGLIDSVHSLDGPFSGYINLIVQRAQESIGKIKFLPAIETSRKPIFDCFPPNTFPHDLYEFGPLMLDRVLCLDKFVSSWNWGSFFVAMLGIAEIMGGVFMACTTLGIGSPIALGLIGEGIGDLIYGIQSGLTKSFSWKGYAIHKAFSLITTVLGGAFGVWNAGTTAILNLEFKGLQALTREAVMLQAQRVGMELLTRTAVIASCAALEKVTEHLPTTVLRVFGKTIRSQIASGKGTWAQETRATIMSLREAGVAEDRIQKTMDHVLDVSTSRTIWAGVFEFIANLVKQVPGVAMRACEVESSSFYGVLAKAVLTLFQGTAQMMFFTTFFANTFTELNKELKQLPISASEAENLNQLVSVPSHSEIEEVTGKQIDNLCDHILDVILQRIRDELVNPAIADCLKFSLSMAADQITESLDKQARMDKINEMKDQPEGKPQGKKNMNKSHSRRNRKNHNHRDGELHGGNRDRQGGHHHRHHHKGNHQGGRHNHHHGQAPGRVQDFPGQAGGGRSRPDGVGRNGHTHQHGSGANGFCRHGRNAGGETVLRRHGDHHPEGHHHQHGKPGGKDPDHQPRHTRDQKAGNHQSTRQPVCKTDVPERLDSSGSQQIPSLQDSSDIPNIDENERIAGGQSGWPWKRPRDTQEWRRIIASENLPDLVVVPPGSRRKWRQFIRAEGRRKPGHTRPKNSWKYQRLFHESLQVIDTSKINQTDHSLKLLVEKPSERTLVQFQLIKTKMQSTLQSDDLVQITGTKNAAQQLQKDLTDAIVMLASYVALMIITHIEITKNADFVEIKKQAKLSNLETILRKSQQIIRTCIKTPGNKILTLQEILTQNEKIEVKAVDFKGYWKDIGTLFQEVNEIQSHQSQLNQALQGAFRSVAENSLFSLYILPSCSSLLDVPLGYPFMQTLTSLLAHFGQSLELPTIQLPASSASRGVLPLRVKNKLDVSLNHLALKIELIVDQTTEIMKLRDETNKYFITWTLDATLLGSEISHLMKLNETKRETIETKLKQQLQQFQTDEKEKIFELFVGLSKAVQKELTLCYNDIHDLSALNEKFTKEELACWLPRTYDPLVLQILPEKALQKLLDATGGVQKREAPELRAGSVLLECLGMLHRHFVILFEPISNLEANLKQLPPDAKQFVERIAPTVLDEIKSIEANEPKLAEETFSMISQEWNSAKQFIQIFMVKLKEVEDKDSFVETMLIDSNRFPFHKLLTEIQQPDQPKPEQTNPPPDPPVDVDPVDVDLGVAPNVEPSSDPNNGVSPATYADPYDPASRGDQEGSAVRKKSVIITDSVKPEDPRPAEPGPRDLLRTPPISPRPEPGPRPDSVHFIPSINSIPANRVEIDETHTWNDMEDIYGVLSIPEIYFLDIKIFGYENREIRNIDDFWFCVCQKDEIIIQLPVIEVRSEADGTIRTIRTHPGQTIKELRKAIADELEEECDCIQLGKTYNDSNCLFPLALDLLPLDFIGKSDLCFKFHDIALPSPTLWNPPDLVQLNMLLYQIDAQKFMIWVPNPMNLLKAVQHITQIHPSTKNSMVPHPIRPCRHNPKKLPSKEN